MKSQMESSIRGEMREIKEKLDTLLTASLEENKDEGQLWERLAKIKTSLQFTERLLYQMNLCATFSLPDQGTQTFLSSVSSD